MIFVKHSVEYFATLGYQRELTYQLDDSSFSAFGKQDKNGSTWLTAFVVKSFSQAKPFIFIDDANLNKSLDFLLSKKKENGAFDEDGNVHDKEMQVRKKTCQEIISLS